MMIVICVFECSQCVAVNYTVLQWITVCCSVCCSALQCVFIVIIISGYLVICFSKEQV